MLVGTRMSFTLLNHLNITRARIIRISWRGSFRPTPLRQTPIVNHVNSWEAHRAEGAGPTKTNVTPRPQPRNSKAECLIDPYSRNSTNRSPPPTRKPFASAHDRSSQRTIHWPRGVSSGSSRAGCQRLSDGGGLGAAARRCWECGSGTHGREFAEGGLAHSKSRRAPRCGAFVGEQRGARVVRNSSAQFGSSSP